MTKVHHIYEFGTFRLDTSARRLVSGNTPITLTPKSFELLQILVENHGRAMSKFELQQALWPNTHVEEGNLPFQMSILRRALGLEGGKAIETVPRHGYLFSAPVLIVPVTDVTTSPPDDRNIAPKHRHFRLLAASAILLSAIVGGIYLMSRERTGMPPLAPVPLTSFPGDEFMPSFSPDGKDVAFVWNGPSGDNWDVYVKVGGVEQPLRITSSAKQDFNPDWSPDGRRIAFARQTDSKAIDILVKPYPDGPERKLGEARKCTAFTEKLDKILDWHPDNEHVIVAGAAAGRNCGLSALSTVTGALTPLTEPPLPSEMHIAPAVSPDGRTLAFMRGSVWPDFSIQALALSAELKPIAAPRPVNTGNRTDLWPAWFPNSKEIIFTSSISSAVGALFRVPVYGAAKPVQLHGLDPVAYFPSISADGSLAYATGSPSNGAIHRFDLSSNPRLPQKSIEIAPSTYMQQSPAYSPDGAQIAFESERSGHREIWISSADGTQLRQLTHFAGPTAQAPLWSPDGTRIACSVALRRQREICIVDAQRGTTQRLTSDLYDDAGASWSRDGKWIYFHSNRSGEYDVWKMPVAGGDSIRLTRAGGLGPQESPDGRFLYFKKHGRQTSLWRIPVEGGPEVRVLDRMFQPAGAFVVKGGIYFMDPPDASILSSTPEFKLRFLDLPGGGVRDIASIAGLVGWGISVAPDRQSLLFVRNKSRAFDLKLVRLVR